MATSGREDQGFEGPPPLLRARSLTEVHFFLDVRGQERQDRYQWSENRGPVTVWIFNTRQSDGRRGRYDFTVDAPEPAPQDGYFGAGPSPLFGPVELMKLAWSMARAAPGTPFGLTPDELTDATRRMEMAYILVMEALRFYQGDDPPTEALKTDDERSALAKAPERYRRARVEELARSYWLLASQLGEALRGAA